MSGERCKTCKFFDEDTEQDGLVKETPDGRGVCLRYPPTVLTPLDSATVTHYAPTLYPLVMPHEWCGEWQPLPPAHMNVDKIEDLVNETLKHLGDVKYSEKTE
jgi:hypothetical protein